MREKFQDRIIWLTGASSGIGEAIAEALSAFGARLILSSTDARSLRRVADRLAAPDRVALVPLDLADGGGLPDCAKRALAKFGTLDMLIHCAGVSQRGLAEETCLDVDRRLMEINYFGTVALTKAVLPHFLSRGSGHIVVVSSLAGKMGLPLRSGYAASKHALHGFFDTLRAEVGTRGISVTVVCPGFVRTNMSVNALTADGSPHGAMDPRTARGMDPRQCAERILQAVARRKNESYVCGKEILMLYLSRCLPGAYGRLVSRIPTT